MFYCKQPALHNAVCADSRRISSVLGVCGSTILATRPVPVAYDATRTCSFTRTITGKNGYTRPVDFVPVPDPTRKIYPYPTHTRGYG